MTLAKISVLTVAVSLAAVAAASAQAPAVNPPPAPSPVAAGAAPALLPADASKDADLAWLSQYLPAAHGKTVYINGGEAFWIEHLDPDDKNDMRVTATIQIENLNDPDLAWRSTYQVTRFDCDSQQQLHIYLTRYTGSGLSGAIHKDSPLINRSEFVSPTSPDFAHLRAACQGVYDRVRARTYAVQVP